MSGLALRRVEQQPPVPNTAPPSRNLCRLSPPTCVWFSYTNSVPACLVPSGGSIAFECLPNSKRLSSLRTSKPTVASLPKKVESTRFHAS